MGRKSSTDRNYVAPSGGVTFAASHLKTGNNQSGTFTPNAATKEIYVWVTGAGGAGGKGGNNYNHGGGGGSGCTVFAHITNVQSSYNWVLGEAGQPVGPDHQGGNPGTNSSFGNIVDNGGEGAPWHESGAADKGVNGSTYADGTIGNHAARGVKFRGHNGMACGGGDQNDDRPNGPMGAPSFWGGGGYAGCLSSGASGSNNGGTGITWGSGGGPSCKPGGGNTGTPGNGAEGVIYIEEYQ